MAFKDALKDYQMQVETGVLMDHPRQRQTLIDIVKQLSKWSTPEVSMYYLWGSVGSGKTLIMNLICKHAPKSTKRWHYGDFINLFSHHVLKKIKGHYTWHTLVSEMFEKRSLICIDEWVIEDITQLMLWKSLLPALWQHKVSIMTTSNVPVEQIYQDGLGRAHFLPMIHTIETKGFVYDLIDPVDYRCTTFMNTQSPFEEAAITWVDQVAHLLSDQPLKPGLSPIYQYNDQLIIIKFFPAITPPSWRKDFIFWAHNFNFVLIDEVSLDKCSRDQLTNWVRLVDLLYDAGTHVFLMTTFTKQQLNESTAWPTRTRSRVMSWLQYQDQWYLQQHNRLQ